MNAHSTYDALRYLADSWGLLAMMVVFVTLCLWPFRSGGKARNDDAARMIFKDESDGE